MDFNTLVYNTLLTIITTGLPVVIAYLVSFIRQHTNAKQLNTAKIIATNAVTYVNQVSKDLGIDNSVKLSSALNSANQLAKKYGVKLDDNQWRLLLESSVLEVKKGLNELDNVIVQPDIPVTELIENNIKEETSTNTISIPEEMMKETYDKVLVKATNDAELAVKSVIETVNKSITEEK